MQRAFYLLTPGGWHDYVNILHPPYTLWHLGYAALGAGLATRPDWPLLGWTLLAFLLAMGVGAHALDELHGRPLRTQMPRAVLWLLGVGGAGAAVAIGVVVGVAATPLMIPCIAAGVFLVFAYNLEWGPFHHDLTFALAWGAFPVLTSFLAQTGGLTAGCVLVALVAALLSHVQRVMSRRVRYLRRTVVQVEGRMVQADGQTVPLTRAWLAQDHDRALALLSVAVPALALGLLLR